MKKLDLVHVCIGEQEALYLAGEQVVAGDYYHDKISEYVRGLMHGLTMLGWDGSYKYWEPQEDYAEELAENSMPEYLDEFEKKRMDKSPMNWSP